MLFASPTPSPLSASLPWLMRLRVAAVLGLALVLTVAWFGLNLRVPLWPMLGLLGVALTSVAVLALWPFGQVKWRIAGILVFDTLLLTAFLGLSGGPSNPFTLFYLLPVVLAAILLGPLAAWGMVALGALGFAALFPWHLPLLIGGAPAPCCEPQPTPIASQGGLAFHLYGMWIAFVVVASCMAAFVNKVVRATKEREAQLQAAKAQADQFASLAALSAGAAHEIATPLGTIALAAHEMEQMAEGDIKADAQLIQRETARCRAILDGMQPDAAQGEAQVQAAFDQMQARFGVGQVQIESMPVAPLQVTVAQPTLERMLGNLVKNALDASPPTARVTLEAQVVFKQIRIQVRDQGTGMDEATLRHVGQPFFTTKEPGSGMGLGLFVTRLLAERGGGSLTLTSKMNQGSCASLTLPIQTEVA